MEPKEFDNILTEAQEAFWAVAAKRLNPKSGDFGPEETLRFDQACREALKTWIRWNVPQEQTYLEFPEINIPEFLQGDDWQDASWHNDVCPRSEHSLPDGAAIRVWVSPDNPEDREYPAMEKFLVEHIPDQDTYTVEENNHMILYQGNSAEEAQAAINRALAK